MRVGRPQLQRIDALAQRLLNLPAPPSTATGDEGDEADEMEELAGAE